MPVQSVPIGSPFTMFQNVVYALPSCRATLFATNVAPGAFIQSLSPNFLQAANPLLVNGSVSVRGGFIKTTDLNPVVTIRRE